MITQYENKTQYQTELKTDKGKIFEVGHGKKAETTKSDPFIKRRFTGLTSWRKL